MLSAVAQTQGPPARRAPATTVPKRSANPLLGAWKTVSYESDRPLAANENPLHPVPVLGPACACDGLRIFTEHYYTFIGLITQTERPSLPIEPPTVDELIAVWAPFAGSGGTYEVHGDTLILDAAITKNPRPRGFQERSVFRIEGDSLFLTANGLTEKSVRLDR